MSYGWATDNAKLRHHKRRKIERRYEKAGAFPTRYWTPDVHVAAFALPTYVQSWSSVGGQRLALPTRDLVARCALPPYSRSSFGKSPNRGRQ